MRQHCQEPPVGVADAGYSKWCLPAPASVGGGSLPKVTHLARTAGAGGMNSSCSTSISNISSWKCLVSICQERPSHNRPLGRDTCGRVWGANKELYNPH